MNNTKPITCQNCGEVLQWFEIMNDGTCPICREQAQADTQADLFPHAVQTFIIFNTN